MKKNMKFNRNNKGQFRRKFPKILIILIVLGALVSYYHYLEATIVDPALTQETVKIIEKDTLTPRVEELKKEVVMRLTEECEYKDWTPNSRPYIIDSNGQGGLQVVFGRWQFVPSTVVHFYKTLYQKDITETEAITIAIDEEKAYQLAHDIIWEKVGGIFHWANCEKSLGLKEEIEWIRKLEN